MGPNQLVSFVEGGPEVEYVNLDEMEGLTLKVDEPGWITIAASEMVL